MSEAEDRGGPRPPEPVAAEAGPAAERAAVEPPPRGVRVMAIVRWVLLAAVALVAVVSVVRYWPTGSDAQETARPDRYWCPMHLEVRSPDPGQCPICHMDLVPIPPEMQKRGAGAGQAAAAGDGGPAGDGGVPPGLVPVTLTLDRLQLGGVETGPVVSRNVGATLRLPATVEAPQTSLSHVHLRTPGFIERVAVRQTGEHVGRGQPLAFVYSPQLYQAQLELLAARRWNAAPGKQGGADGGARTAGSELAQVAAAGRTSLELQGMATQDIDAVIRSGEPLRAVPLRAPAKGYVIRIQAILGMYATEEMILYEISDLSRVWVVGSLYTPDLPSVRPGMTGRFESAATPGEGIEGVVELVEPEVGAATRTAQVRLVVDNPDQRLRPGQYGDLIFDVAGRESLVVPRDAVVDTGEHQYVFLDRGGGRLEPRRVRTGGLFGEQREILEGLSAGDVVVTRGAFLIDSESRLAASIEQAP